MPPEPAAPPAEPAAPPADPAAPPADPASPPVAPPGDPTPYSFVDSLDVESAEPLKEWAAKKTFPDQTAVASALYNLEVKLGESTSAEFIKIPGESASDADRAAYRQKMGIPDDAAGYGFQKPETMPENVEWSDERAGAYSAKFAEIGLSKAQAEALLEFDLEQQGSATSALIAADNAAREERMNALKERWGPDNFDRNMQESFDTVTWVAPHLDPKNNPVFSDPDLVDFFYNLKGQLSEDTTRGMPDPSAGNVQSLQEEMGEIVKNPAYRGQMRTPTQEGARLMKRAAEISAQIAMAQAKATGQPLGG